MEEPGFSYNVGGGRGYRNTQGGQLLGSIKEGETLDLS